MQVVVLGAARSIGRSCVLVKTPDGTNLLLDYGVDLAQDDVNRFPSDWRNFASHIDAVFITHSHSDHFAGVVQLVSSSSGCAGYRGPIYMTNDTFKLGTGALPEALSDGVNQLKDWWPQVVVIGMQETVRISRNVTVQALPAGHTAGAVMFLVESTVMPNPRENQSAGCQRLLYTGDFSLRRNPSFGCAQMPVGNIDILISECTYFRHANVNTSHSALEEAVNLIGQCKTVLVPVMGPSRLLEVIQSLLSAMPDGSFGQKTLAIQPNLLNDSLVSSLHCIEGLKFEPLKEDEICNKIVVAFPGMCQYGRSYHMALRLLSGSHNGIIFTTHCAESTLAWHLLRLSRKGSNSLQWRSTTYPINCRVAAISANAHVDKGDILTTVQQLRPKHWVLVHGTASSMEQAKTTISRSAKSKDIHVIAPHNGEVLCLA